MFAVDELEVAAIIYPKYLGSKFNDYKRDLQGFVGVPRVSLSYEGDTRDGRADAPWWDTVTDLKPLWCRSAATLVLITKGTKSENVYGAVRAQLDALEKTYGVYVVRLDVRL